jgi:hypothetical protein
VLEKRIGFRNSLACSPATETIQGECPGVLEATGVQPDFRRGQRALSVDSLDFSPEKQPGFEVQRNETGRGLCSSNVETKDAEASESTVRNVEKLIATPQNVSEPQTEGGMGKEQLVIDFEAVRDAEQVDRNACEPVLTTPEASSIEEGMLTHSEDFLEHYTTVAQAAVSADPPSKTPEQVRSMTIWHSAMGLTRCRLAVQKQQNIDLWLAEKAALKSNLSRLKVQQHRQAGRAALFAILLASALREKQAKLLLFEGIGNRRDEETQTLPDASFPGPLQAALLADEAVAPPEDAQEGVQISNVSFRLDESSRSEFGKPQEGRIFETDSFLQALEREREQWLAEKKAFLERLENVISDARRYSEGRKEEMELKAQGEGGGTTGFVSAEAVSREELNAEKRVLQESGRPLQNEEEEAWRLSWESAKGALEAEIEEGFQKRLQRAQECYLAAEADMEGVIKTKIVQALRTREAQWKDAHSKMVEAHRHEVEQLRAEADQRGKREELRAEVNMLRNLVRSKEAELKTKEALRAAARAEADELYMKKDVQEEELEALKRQSNRREQDLLAELAAIRGSDGKQEASKPTANLGDRCSGSQSRSSASKVDSNTEEGSVNSLRSTPWEAEKQAMEAKMQEIQAEKARVLLSAQEALEGAITSHETDMRKLLEDHERALEAAHAHAKVLEEEKADLLALRQKELEQAVAEAAARLRGDWWMEREALEGRVQESQKLVRSMSSEVDKKVADQAAMQVKLKMMHGEEHSHYIFPRQTLK